MRTKHLAIQIECMFLFTLPFHPAKVHLRRRVAEKLVEIDADFYYFFTLHDRERVKLVVDYMVVASPIRAAKVFYVSEVGDRIDRIREAVERSDMFGEDEEVVILANQNDLDLRDGVVLV